LDNLKPQFLQELTVYLDKTQLVLDVRQGRWKADDFVRIRKFRTHYGISIGAGLPEQVATDSRLQPPVLIYWPPARADGAGEWRHKEIWWMERHFARPDSRE
jgi:hypothetical protein